MKIKSLTAREILDSNGRPTIEAQVGLEDGTVALGQVPSGSSVGTTEAVELRDGDGKRYFGKGVLKAIENIKGPIRAALLGQEANDQKTIDQIMISLDGTENKANLGGNATVGVSMAVCRAAARSKKLALYEYLGKLAENQIFNPPQPLILVMEGGKHGDWATDIQEYFVVPNKERFPTFAERLRAGAEIFHALELILQSRGYSTGIGYEGAFCPKGIKSNEEAFQLIIQATEKAGYSLPGDLFLGFDAAASEFFESDKYKLKRELGVAVSSSEWLDRLLVWSKKYPVRLMEDPFDEEDWGSWSSFLAQAGNEVQIVGDDLVTTNNNRIQKAIERKAINSLIIKPNQIGTISETLEAMKLAQSAGLKPVVSHRGGEPNDDFIADFVVGTGAGQCKFGGPSRGERVAKYNRLLRIEERLTSQ